MENNDFLLIGKVVGAHGIKGVVKVVSYAESSEVFDPERPIMVAGTGGREEHFEIIWARPHHRTVLLALKEVDTREKADMLKGGDVYIRRTSLPEPEDGSYYWFDIIGLDVYTLDHQYLGRIDSIMPTGGNDVYVVREGKREVLIPALESVVRSIDLSRNIMCVDLPEGL